MSAKRDRDVWTAYVLQDRQDACECVCEYMHKYVCVCVFSHSMYLRMRARVCVSCHTRFFGSAR